MGENDSDKRHDQLIYRKMMDGDQELGQHFEPHRNTEDSGGDFGEPPQICTTATLLLEQFCCYFEMLPPPARGVAYTKYSLVFLLANLVSEAFSFLSLLFLNLNNNGQHVLYTR